MTAGRAWSLAFWTGVLALLAMELVPWLPVAVALLAAGAGAFGRRRLIGLSGVLIGFGALWSLLVGLQFMTGGHSDQLELIVAAGIVPIVVGIVLAVIARDG